MLRVYWGENRPSWFSFQSLTWLVDWLKTDLHLIMHHASVGSCLCLLILSPTYNSHVLFTNRIQNSRRIIMLLLRVLTNAEGCLPWLQQCRLLPVLERAACPTIWDKHKQKWLFFWSIYIGEFSQSRNTHIQSDITHRIKEKMNSCGSKSDVSPGRTSVVRLLELSPAVFHQSCFRYYLSKSQFPRLIPVDSADAFWKWPRRKLRVVLPEVDFHLHLLDLVMSWPCATNPWRW